MYRYLVSTHETQGYRNNDFCFVPEGEILRYGSKCDSQEIDGNCGCKRAMIGIKAMKSTTTMKVVELDITETDLSERLSISLDAAGWDFTDKGKEYFTKEIQNINRIANSFPLNSILERRGEEFIKRK